MNSVHLSLLLAAAATADIQTVERWRMAEFAFAGPNGSQPGSNPFVDVQISASFSLVNATDSFVAAATKPPTPLVALDIIPITNQSTVINTGSSSKAYPSAGLLGVHRSSHVPAGSSGQSLDFGLEVTSRHVVQLPADGRPFKGGLAGLAAFTISGWIHLVGGAEGAGGDRVVNYCNGGGGIDLVWEAANGGRLKLAVNEWPDGDHPTSADYSMPPSPQGWPVWRYFAVSYDSQAPAGTDNVKWYFGDSDQAASLDHAATHGQYNQGTVSDPELPLAFGNFGTHFNANDRMLRGLLYEPKVFSGALAEEEIVTIQHRAGCRPSCGANSCGSNGCGGSCGSCGGQQVCGSRGSGPRVCEMPTTVVVRGFYDGDGIYKIRFAPPFEGTWHFETAANVQDLDAHWGSLVATAPTGSNHGAVLSNGFAFEHSDGTSYFSVGSTSYQWSSMPLAMQAQTLQTLREGQGDGQVFNKQRMTVFPKWYRNNHQNPVEVGTAYDIIPGSAAANETSWNCVGGQCPSNAGSFDFTRFNVSYWRNYEQLIAEMQTMGVIADIIVFHPYDNGHWGFDCMGGRDPATYNTTNDNFYLEYLAARLSSFSNVWWAMANEWNFCACKSFNASADGPTPVWDELFKTLSAADPYGREMSIHNGQYLYNHSQPWITHVSLQGHEDDTPALRNAYQKPVVWDEERYEGNISSSWGAMSGEEMTDRFWWGASLGAHVGHSETILRNGVDDDDQPLWWAKGGELIGTSPARIKWFRSLWESGERPEFGGLVPSQSYLGDSSHSDLVVDIMSATDGSYLFLHFLRPGKWAVPLAHTGYWEVYYLDYWNMKVETLFHLPLNATNAVIDVASIPGNYEVRLVGVRSRSEN